MRAELVPESCTNLEVASHSGQKRRQRFILLIPQLATRLPSTCR